jgi:hypothetical protein
MRGFGAASLLAGALLLLVTSTGSAKDGPSMATLTSQGWTCFPGGIMIHCVHPNTDVDALFASELPSVPSLNFSLPAGERFLGTEILIRADLGSDGRPCNQGTEPEETDEKGRTFRTYEPVDFSDPLDGIPEYYSCHHNNEL